MRLSRLIRPTQALAPALAPALGLAPALALVLALVLALLGSPACGDRPAPRLDAYFVRDGLALAPAGQAAWRLLQGGQVVLAAGSKGVVALPGGRYLAPVPWRPGESFRLEAGGQSLELFAPQRPSPLLVCTVELENLRPHGSQMGDAPDTEVCFSPQGDRLAVGTFTGRLLLVRVPSGEEVWSRKLPEGLVKRLAWGNLAGRQVLYVGEQSPQGLVYCLDAADGAEIWRFDASRVLGRGSLAGDRRHAIYNLPGVYDLRVLPDGDLLLVATHGRFQGENFRHDCRVWRLGGTDGQVRWRWPREANFPYGITWVGASAKGETLAFMSFNTFGPQVAGPFQDGTLYCLDGSRGRERWRYQVPPLKPYYSRVGAWQAVSVSPRGRGILLGLNDGRAMLFDAAAGARGPRWELPVGAPLMVGDLPVGAPVSYARLSDEAAYLVTPGTTIPAGMQTDQRTPQPHPHARHLFAYDWQGNLLWQHQTQGAAQGLALSPTGREVAVGVGASPAADDRNEFGLSLFRAGPARGKGPLLYHFATNGPAYYRLAISAGGRYLALTESPFTRDEGKTVQGSYRVLVIH
ncbi:MAG: PQQ-binding-like beta-propeller repeat protein [Deltaproteobacteria bacterium]|nr:PQQ-binding-like beta-propeller repeat protein [Deltaproteobacteria bacterium]